MREHDNQPLGKQEAIAYSDSRYDQHLKAKQIADEEYEYLRWMMEAAQAKIDVWRTQSSNNRKGI
jgi:5-bromo-4-chloroindolyl phosphate hydrolysis protein